MFKILIVEESPSTRELLKESLQKLGCAVLFADTSEEIYQTLRATRIDAVFADLCMRNMNVRAISRDIKSQYPETKFFLLTGWKGDLDKEMLLVDGIHAVFRKPIIFSKIRDTILEYFG